MTKKPDTRILIVAIVVIGLGAMLGISMLFNVMPAEHTIKTASGDIVTSGSTISYTEGLVLEMDYLIDNATPIECHLWDIEEDMSVEVGVFSQDEWGTSIWTFALDNLRNNTNLYKLVLAGDLSGETFTFYINGEEADTITDTTTTTTTPPPDDEEGYYNMVVVMAMGFVVVGIVLICFRRK